jgi:hypothetical protein
MLRALVGLLLLANVAFLVWSQGWLGNQPQHSQREPARLAAQVRPESLTVLPPAKAGAAVQAARAAAQTCLEAGPFGEGLIGAAEAALATAQLPAEAWSRVDPSAAPVWLVYGGRYPEAAARKAREEELRRAGQTYELIEFPAELAPGFVLSRHGSRDDAEAWIKARAKADLRGLRVVQLPSSSPTYRLRVPRADTEQAERLLALPAEPLGGGFKPCAVKG